MTHTQEIERAPIQPQPLTDPQLTQLMRDLHPSRVSTRKQGSSNLSYLEAWDVKATLIRVFGFGGFSAEALECEIVRIEDNVPKTKGYGKDKVELPIEYTEDGRIKFGTANFRVTAKVRVRLTIPQLGATYTEWAASSQTGPDLGEVTDFAIKTAESDGLKRAAIYLGTQFGLSLYDNGSTLDVIKTVLAPGQEWARGFRLDPKTGKPLDPKTGKPFEEVQQEKGQPATAGQSVSHVRANGVTEEQHQVNLGLLDQAMTAKRNQRELASDPNAHDIPQEDAAAKTTRRYRGGAMNPGYDASHKSEGMAEDIP